jgi:hypothetical protein
MSARASVLAACLLAVACGHSSRPFDRSVPIGRPSSGESVADVPVRGHVITLSTRRGTVTGELLAVGPRELMILGENDNQIVRFSEIEDVDIKLYRSYEGATGAWTGVGTASALTHGLIAIISIPVWLISGITVTAGEAENSRVEAVDLAKLYQYARFPQGMPQLAPPPAPAEPPPLAPDASPQSQDASMPPPPILPPPEEPAGADPLPGPIPTSDGARPDVGP